MSRIQTRGKPYACSVCVTKIRQKHNLKDIDEKCYACSFFFCDKKFVEDEALHEEKKPFKCVICEYTFDKHIQEVFEGKKHFYWRISAAEKDTMSDTFQKCYDNRPISKMIHKYLKIHGK
jgi:hypothetical protein